MLPEYTSPSKECVFKITLVVRSTPASASTLQKNKLLDCIASMETVVLKFKPDVQQSSYSIAKTAAGGDQACQTAVATIAGNLTM